MPKELNVKLDESYLPLYLWESGILITDEDKYEVHLLCATNRVDKLLTQQGFKYKILTGNAKWYYLVGLAESLKVFTANELLQQETNNV